MKTILLTIALVSVACKPAETNEEKRVRLYEERKAAGYPDPGSESGSFTGWGNH